MIIRSADNETLINFDNLSIVQIEHYELQTDSKHSVIVYDVMAYDTGRKAPILMGRYRTKEKAVEVLSGIIETYAVDYCMGIYQMPLEE